MHRAVVLGLALLALPAAPGQAHGQGRSSAEVVPGWVCPGDSVSIRWDTGEASALTLATITSGDAVAEKLAPGTSSVWRRVDTTTVFRITAMYEGAEWSHVDTVQVHPSQMEHHVSRPAASCAGRLALTTFGLPPGGSSERIIVATVVNRGDRTVWIHHRGFVVRLDPGQASAQFADLPFSGDWGIIVDTGPYNPACPLRADSDAPRPPPVEVVIISRCRDQ